MKKNAICIVRHREYYSDPRVMREAEALVNSGYQVDVLCLKGENERNKQQINGINIYRLTGKRLRSSKLRYIFEYFLFFFCVFLKLNILNIYRRYVIIQVNNLPDFLVFVAIIPKIFGAKVLLDLQESTPEFYASKYNCEIDSNYIKIIKIIEKLSARFADHVLTIHTTMRDTFVEHGIPYEKISCILNVPDDSIFNYHKIHKNLKNNNKKTFILISHGAILKRYGYQIALEALKIVKNKIPEITFWIVGNGDYLSEIREKCRQLSLEDKVKFFGYIPIQEIPKLIYMADIGLVPVLRDIYTDLMHANKMFEYIAMRRPVIVTRVRAVSDYFNDESIMFFSSGNSKQLADCIIELYNNCNKIKKIERNAFKIYQKICWKKMKRIYLEVIENIIKND